MAETSEGYDGGPFMFERGWADAFGAAISSGPYPTGTTNLEVFTDQDGRQVKVRAGSGIVRGHPYYSDATKILALTPNTSGLTRIDTVVLRLDTVGKKTTTEVRAGTAASTPQRPTLTRQPGGVWEEPLASVTLANGFSTVTTGNVSDERTYAIKDGEPGDVKPWPGTTAPLGWKLCNGASLRRDAWTRLFAVVGTTWGTTSAVTFTLPDFRDKFITGANSDVGTYAGDSTFTLSEANMPAHKHAVDGDLGNRYVVTVGSSSLFLAGSGAQAVSFSDTDPTGGGSPIFWRPPYAKTNFVIRAA